MRRRLLRFALLTVAVPLAVKAVEGMADRIEAVNGPSGSSRALRRASTIGRRLSRIR